MEIKRINGYDLKDEIARINISKIYANNVADMKIKNLVIGDVVKTLGYYESNDGGQGLYLIRSKTDSDIDNGGTIHILNNNLVAELIVEDKVNAKQFGAKGDNNQDDTLFIQKALDYCSEKSIGLFIPAGKYKITDTLNNTGVNVEGDGCRNTIFIPVNCDTMKLNQFNAQYVCVISKFAICPDSLLTENGGIVFTEYDAVTERSRGYKLTDLYFNYLGCAIEVNDSFRTTICDVGINKCIRGVWVKRQTVQGSFYNVVSNCDLTGVSSSRYGNKTIGFQIGKSGDSVRPEGIKLHHVCMTAHDIGLYIHDVLYCTVCECEFDYCHENGIYTLSHEGNLTIRDSWVVSDGNTAEPVVKVQTASTTNKYRLNLINNLIGNVNGHAEKMGIRVGGGESHYFKHGVNIDGNVIKNFNGAIPLQYGIYVNRARNCNISNNYAHGCSEADIYFLPDIKGTLINNKADKIKLYLFAGITLYAYANICESYNNTIGGTLIGDIK